MNLQDQLCGHLKLHAELIGCGMNSTQALNLIAFPMETQNLKEAISVLTVNQLDELVYALRDSAYAIGNRKSRYMICGLLNSKDGVLVQFTDNVLQIDSFTLYIDELTGTMKNDILKSIRQVL